MDPVSDIKARLTIEELVSSYCQLHRKGRNLVALCPFHNDTHPSFLISPDKGIAYCFACQSGGDIFSFYQKIENVDFRQALKDLAERAGVELPREKFVGPAKDERERIRECLEAAATFFSDQLRHSEKAGQYLTERHMPPELVATFRIGYAPDSFDATYTHLLKAGFSRKEILGAGLGVQKELSEERIYDRFRNRIVFPILNHQGGIIGFGGRTLGKDDAKYINSPDGPLYNKSSALFGFSLAKEAIREKKNVLLVEGYFDVIACHRLGVKNVVAVSGTALTEQHVAILKRSAETVTLCLDRDHAGESAAERAFLLCARHDLRVLSVTLPSGKDPDECAALAPDALRELCASGAVPYFEKILASLRERGGEKHEALKRLLPLLQSTASAVEREEYVRKAAQMLGATVTALEDDLRRHHGVLAAPAASRAEGFVSPTPFTTTDLFLGLLLTYPSLLSMITELIEPEGEAEKALYSALQGHYTRAQARELCIDDLSLDCRERAAVLQFYCEEHFGSWSKGMAAKEIRKLCKRANRDLLLRKQHSLVASIRHARSTGKKMEEEQLLTQYQKVLKLAQLASS